MNYLVCVFIFIDCMMEDDFDVRLDLLFDVMILFLFYKVLDLVFICWEYLL